MGSGWSVAPLPRLPSRQRSKASSRQILQPKPPANATLGVVPGPEGSIRVYEFVGEHWVRRRSLTKPAAETKEQCKTVAEAEEKEAEEQQAQEDAPEEAHEAQEAQEKEEEEEEEVVVVRSGIPVPQRDLDGLPRISDITLSVYNSEESKDEAVHARPRRFSAGIAASLRCLRLARRGSRGERQSMAVSEPSSFVIVKSVPTDAERRSAYTASVRRASKPQLNIWDASQQGDFQAVAAALLRHPTIVNERHPHFDRTPLFLASLAGQAEVCMLLMRFGAEDPDNTCYISAMPNCKVIIRDWETVATSGPAGLDVQTLEAQSREQVRALLGDEDLLEAEDEADDEENYFAALYGVAADY